MSDTSAGWKLEGNLNFLDRSTIVLLLHTWCLLFVPAVMSAIDPEDWSGHGLQHDLPDYPYQVHRQINMSP
ncbi:hypothetical protein P691DRAFT_803592 [Macrolepiota fuliginosa MF-IS2]|uniref:Uncharacterized protein n=1 Tax=Macrolepiota fuliginosa MF-IS2 TaxID=1400762 RepID=A0A9P6C2I0_9AGAR|nr:hypothetical protein P691DRAFT_803592 [Macrolepiota fuliginosa MF-IS2]